MAVTSPAERLTIFLDETDRRGRTPLCTEIVGRARAARMAGATVVHGAEGFGASTHLHVAAPARLTDRGVPAVVVIVDAPDRIRAFMPVVTELVGDGLVIRQPVEVVRT